MSHKRKDTLVPPPEMWKHLRPFFKRMLSGKERQAAKGMIEAEVEEALTKFCPICDEALFPEEEKDNICDNCKWLLE